MLKVSFAFPVLNEEKNLERCLKSIREQYYPQELVEIVLADGGSTDRTLEIAKKYNCIVIDNPYKTAERGAVLAHEKATGDIKVFLAADNVLFSTLWISQMLSPFRNPDVWGTYTHIETKKVFFPDFVEQEKKDTSINRYYSSLQVEPFTWFVYGKDSDPRTFRNLTDPMKHPLLAFAQGFCIRADFKRKPEYMNDDILPVIQMIEEGKKIVYISAGIYHFHLTSFKQYLKKFRQRIKSGGFNNRAKYMSKYRIFRKYLFMVYGLTLIAPLFHSIVWAVKKRQLFWLWHFPATVGLAYLILWEIVRKGFSRDLTMGNNLPRTSLEIVFYALILGLFILVGIVAFINVFVDRVVDYVREVKL